MILAFGRLLEHATLQLKTFEGENFCKLFAGVVTKRCHASQFTEKTFANSLKFARVFPLGSFPLYGNCRYDVMLCPSSSAIGMKQFFFHLLSIFGRLSIEPQLNELWIHMASQKCAGGSTWEGGCGHVDTSVFNSVKSSMWSLWLSPQRQSCSLHPWFLMSVQKWPFYLSEMLC